MSTEGRRAGIGASDEGTPAPRCTRCGVPLLPNEHTREQGICHSCWSQELAYGASEREERAE